MLRNKDWRWGKKQKMSKEKLWKSFRKLQNYWSGNFKEMRSGSGLWIQAKVPVLLSAGFFSAAVPDPSDLAASWLYSAITSVCWCYLWRCSNPPCVCSRWCLHCEDFSPSLFGPASSARVMCHKLTFRDEHYPWEKTYMKRLLLHCVSQPALSNERGPSKPMFPYGCCQKCQDMLSIHSTKSYPARTRLPGTEKKWRGKMKKARPQIWQECYKVSLGRKKASNLIQGKAWIWNCIGTGRRRWRK